MTLPLFTVATTWRSPLHARGAANQLQVCGRAYDAIVGRDGRDRTARAELRLHSARLEEAGRWLLSAKMPAALKDMPFVVFLESSSVILGEKTKKVLEPSESESLYLVRVGGVLGARGRGWEGKLRTGRRGPRH